MTHTQQYSNINRAAIILAVEAFRSNDELILSQLGLNNLDSSTIDSLRNMSINHLACTQDFRGLLVNMNFDSRQVGLFISLASRRTQEDEQIDKLIRYGMRQGMLEHLKGVTRREFDSRRTRLQLPANARGRIETLCESDELLVLRSWQSLSLKIDDLLQRYIALHEDTLVSLDRACLTIQQVA